MGFCIGRSFSDMGGGIAPNVRAGKKSRVTDTIRNSGKARTVDRRARCRLYVGKMKKGHFR